MSNASKVLFLPEWYPNKTHLSVGSFIRVHAEAINAKIPVDVLHVCGDVNAERIYSFEKSVVNGVNTYILYYRKSKLKNPISQLIKAVLYVVGQFYGYYLYRKQNSRPLLIHVHVLTRAAILPFIFSLFAKQDYFISEQWTRYLPQDGSYSGKIRKFFANWVAKRSKGISAISQDLKFHMNRHGITNSNFRVISNVVKPIFFESNNDAKSIENHFCHVSNFKKVHKNIPGTLEAFKLTKDLNLPFSFTMVGDGDDFKKAQQMVEDYALETVNFTGFLYGNDVVEEMAKASALVLFSNYETQGVVIIESLSLGVPVIATDTSAIPEMINETNGILVEPNNVDALAKAIAQIINKEVSFDKDKIKEDAAKKYKGDVIAQQFIEFYRAGGVNI
ncbi:MAG: glycosyltransferase [Pedobacter sp.]